MASDTQPETTLSAEALSALLEAARGAFERAYAPYSHFQVGAAVLDEDGRIFAGCNVENASYGLTICAERNAAAAAVAAGARRLRAALVFTAAGEPTPPCGACRQVLAEFNPAMEIHLVTQGGRRAFYTLDRLLPAAFEFRP